jgi:WD40 repeat protein
MFLLKGHTQGICEGALAFSRDGRWLASSSHDGTARVWDLTTRTTAEVFQHPYSAVTGVGFIRQDSCLVTGSWDNLVRVWELASKRLLKSFRPNETICYLTVSADSKTIAAAGGGFVRSMIHLWDAATLKKKGHIGYHDSQIGALAFSADGRWLASGSADSSARLWDRPSGENRGILTHRGWIHGLDFSPDSRTLAVAAGRTVHLWNIDPKISLDTIVKGFQKTVNSVRFTPDGRQIIAGSKDGSVRLWDRALKRITQVYRWKIGHVAAIAIAPDGLTAAAGGEHGDILIWDLG